MLINGLNFEDEIITAMKNNTLVIFAGAGVSVGPPTNLASFRKLVDIIANGHHEEYDSTRFPSLDVYLGELEFGGMKVKEIASKYFSERKILPNILHASLLKMFSNNQFTRIVTTNYENAIQLTLPSGSTVKSYSSPALPQGDDFNGIVHIHGVMDEAESMILTDSDFGKAYLLDGYVSRFLVKLFSEYTVLFIGYSHDDFLMKYLSRGLPNNLTNKRYILTDKNEKKWNVFGIKPIMFPKGEYELLPDTLEKLSNRVFNSPVDWKNDIKKYAMTLPPLDDDTNDIILQIFDQKQLLMMFIENFDEKLFDQWFKWLFENKLLDFIGNNIDASIEQKIICKWVVSIDLKEHNLFYITNAILLKNKIINKTFFDSITHILYSEGNSISDDTFKKTIMLFIHEIHQNNLFVFQRLIKLCVKRKMIKLAFFLFDKLLDQRFELKNSFSEPTDLSGPKGVFADNVTFDTSNLWEETLKPYLDQNIDFIYNSTLQRLENQFIFLREFQVVNAETNYNLVFYDLEVVTKDRYIRKNWILYSKILLESLNVYETMESDDFKLKVKRLLESQDIILIKIGLIAVKKSTNFDLNFRFKVCMTNDFYDNRTHTEMFRLVKSIFDQLSEYQQRRIIIKICKELNLKSPEKNKNYRAYNWLIWLSETDDSYFLIDSILYKHRALFMDYKKRESPDLLVYTSGTNWIANSSPLDEQAISQLSIEKIIPLVRHFVPYDISVNESVTKEGLIRSISNYASNNFSWKLNLLQSLLPVQPGDIDLWSTLLENFGSEVKNDEEGNLVVNTVLCGIDEKELLIVTSKLAYDLITNEHLSKQWFIENEDDLLIILDYFYDNPSDSNYDTQDFILASINSNATYTALSFLNLLIKHDDSQGIPKDYTTRIKKYLNGAFYQSFLFAPILVGYYRVMFAKDESILRELVLHNLDSTNKSMFISSWQGLLHYSPVIFTDSISYLIEYYQTALIRFDEFPKETQERFIESFTVVIVHFDQKKLNTISRLFSKISIEQRNIFLGKLRSTIEEMDEIKLDSLWDDWLYDFIDNISLNNPVTYAKSNLVEILGLVLFSGRKFAEVVQIIEKWGPLDIVESSQIVFLVSKLDKMSLADNEKIYRLRLIVYLYSCNYSSYIEESIFTDFFDKQESIPKYLSNRITNISYQN